MLRITFTKQIIVLVSLYCCLKLCRFIDGCSSAIGLAGVIKGLRFFPHYCQRSRSVKEFLIGIRFFYVVANKSYFTISSIRLSAAGIISGMNQEVHFM